MIEKRQLARNFSKGARSYDLYAAVQREMAQLLMEKIKKNIRTVEMENILEIGCGTGIFSELLLGLFPGSSFLFMDIAEKMAMAAAMKLGKRDNACFVIGDAEEKLPDGKFDIVASSAVFQWIVDVEKLEGNIYNSLNEGGYLCFATFLDGSFKEFSSVMGEGYTQKMKSFQEIKEVFSRRFETVEEIRETIVEGYKDFDGILRYFKNIGAAGSMKNKKPFSKGIYLKARGDYENEFADKTGMLNVTNEIGIFIFRKK